MKTKTKLYVLLSLFTLLACATLVHAAPVLTATPNNSNIFQVNGSGFNANETIILKLLAGNVSVYVFPNLTANGSGSFSGTEIIPTSINGTYNITAIGSSSLLNASVLGFSVPNLDGPNGVNGTDGVNGTNGLDFNSTGNVFLFNGTKGDPGQSIIGPAGPTSPFVYVGLAFSLIAISIAVWEKREKQTE